MAQICNRTRLRTSWPTTVRGVRAYLYDITESVADAGPRHNSLSARRPNRFAFASAEREEREGAQALARPHLFCPIRIRTVQPSCAYGGGGIELVPLLTADVGASVPFSSVDRWVRVCDNKSEYIVVGIKTSYMCCVLTFFFSVCLATIFTLLQLV